MITVENRTYRARASQLALLVALHLATPSASDAGVTLYYQDFEAAPVGQFAHLSPGLGIGLVDSTANMGGSALSWNFTAGDGAAGTKGMDVEFDATGRPVYDIAFSTGGPSSSDENLPTSDPSKIRLSMDARTAGAITPTPLRLRIFQNDPRYEADRNIDVNMDGDMTDGATPFESVLSPVLIQDGSYQRLSFTAGQGLQRAYMSDVPPFPGTPRLIPLTPEFDPTVTVKFTVIFGDEEFGFDAGNVVSIDNIRLDVIPEPSTIALATALVLAPTWRRNRKRF